VAEALSWIGSALVRTTNSRTRFTLLIVRTCIAHSWCRDSFWSSLSLADGKEVTLDVMLDWVSAGTGFSVLKDEGEEKAVLKKLGAVRRIT
jgi:hypothetical protein